MNANHAFIISMFFVLGAEAFAKAPAWFTAFDQKRTGSIIEVSCSGRGPDKALANQASLNECRGIGVQYVSGFIVKTKSIAVETTKSADWHSESSSDVIVTGLECEPLKQECSEESETWTCYHVCRFNLAKAKLEAQSKEDPLRHVTDIDSVLANPDESNLARTKSRAKPSFVQSGTRTLVLSTVPTCDDVLVVGSPSRIVKCKEMPITLIIGDTDREAIARLSGFKPKHLQFTTRKPGSESKAEEATVYFEK